MSVFDPLVKQTYLKRRQSQLRRHSAGDYNRIVNNAAVHSCIDFYTPHPHFLQALTRQQSIAPPDFGSGAAVAPADLNMPYDAESRVTRLSRTPSANFSTATGLTYNRLNRALTRRDSKCVAKCLFSLSIAASLLIACVRSIGVLCAVYCPSRLATHCAH